MERISDVIVIASRPMLKTIGRYVESNHAYIIQKRISTYPRCSGRGIAKKSLILDLNVWKYLNFTVLNTTGLIYGSMQEKNELLVLSA